MRANGSFLKELAPLPQSLGIYVHIPFCAHVCPYCDFATEATSRKQFSSFAKNVVQEIELKTKLFLGRDTSVHTIYFGGGTPSILDYNSFEYIVCAIKKHFNCSDLVEFTAEINPCDVTTEWLEMFRSLGGTRLSVGVQSLRDERLKFLGRNHDSSSARQALASINEFGHFDLSIDLICGLPNEEWSALALDLEEALVFSPNHFSLYTLTIEQGTPFFRMAEQGKLRPAPDSKVRSLFLRAREFLQKAGIVQYEVSNFAREGFQSIHNRNYWSGSPYLGFGPGAHSYLIPDFFDDIHQHTRTANVRSRARYEELLADSQVPTAWSESLNLEQRKLEYLYLSLRQVRGILGSDYYKQFSSNLVDDFPLVPESADLHSEQLGSDGRWYLSAENLLLLDSIVPTLID